MINSVKNQTYDNIEHIIIDGGSNDGSIELYKELGLKYISEKDNGIYDAFNKGVNLAKGKYINFMNSDDFFCNSKAVELSVKALEKTNADFSCAKASIIWSNGCVKTMKPKMHYVYFRMPFCHQTMFCKTDVIKKEGFFDLNFKSASDYDLILRLVLRHYKYVTLKENIVTFRYIGESAKNVRLSVEEQLEILKKNYGSYVQWDDNKFLFFWINRYFPTSVYLKLPFGFKSLFAFIKAHLRYIRRKIIHISTSSKKERWAISIFGYKITESGIAPLCSIKTVDEYINGN